MDKFKFKECADRDCDVFFKQFNRLQKYCGSACASKNRKPPNLKLKSMKPIPKFSAKMKALKVPYENVRIEVLTEARFKCFIEGCTNVANTCEHLMGRKGFADEYARENNIPLLIDKRYLRACCLAHNGELETNPELSKQYQYSKITGKKKSDQ